MALGSGRPSFRNCATAGGTLPDHVICDVRDSTALGETVRRADPEIIFHMAAQSLVRRSYRDPLYTWQTNVNGTLNLLEAARSLGRPVTVVVVTTDKVYKNREWEFAYREEDELGGYDPYSASKAACELAVSSWRSAFSSDSGVTVVTARAGNVIGAGDVCEDRLVPDCFRAWRNGDAVQLRNPGSTRPWQHVLEPLSGYIALAAHARAGRSSIFACNFGPDSEGTRTVETLVRALSGLGTNRAWTVIDRPSEHEARALSLSIDRARHKLGWTPRLSFAETVAWTNEGYAADQGRLRAIVQRQIREFESKSSSVFAN